MFTLADRRGVYLAEAFMYRHHPKTHTLKRVVESRDLGEIHTIRTWFTYPAEDAAADIRFQPGMDGGALRDVGSYPVSMCNPSCVRVEQESLDELLPLCAEKGIALIFGGVFNSGILTTGAVAGAHHNYGPANAEVLARVRQIEMTCARFDVPIAAVALQFVLAHPAVVSALVGASTTTQRALNFHAAAVDIPAELWAELRAQELIRIDAPTPS